MEYLAILYNKITRGLNRYLKKNKKGIFIIPLD